LFTAQQAIATNDPQAISSIRTNISNSDCGFNLATHDVSHLLSEEIDQQQQQRPSISILVSHHPSIHPLQHLATAQ
jgi:hypothetical protein